MRRIFITILILIFCVSSVNAADYTGLTIDQAKRLNQLNKWINYDINSKRVQDLSLTRALDTSKEKLKVAAEIAARNETKQVTKAVYLEVGKSAAKKIIGGAALMGAFALAEMYVDWLISQGNPDQGLMKKDGMIYRTDQSTTLSPCDPCKETDAYCNYIGHYEDNAGARSSVSGGDVLSGPFNGSCRGPDTLIYTYVWVVTSATQTQNGRRWSSYGKQYITYVENPATLADLEIAAGNGFVNDIDTAWKVTNDILDDVTDSLHNPDSGFWYGPDANHETGVDNPNDYIIPELINTIPQTDIDQINQDLLDPDVPGTTPEEDLDKSSTYYQGPQVDQTAKLLTGLRTLLTEMNNNAANETLTPLPPLPPEGPPPDKDSIYPILDGFIDGLGQLPVVSFFTDIKDNIDFSGDCNFSLSMPNPMNNTVQEVPLSLCPYQTTFEFMGSCLLLIVSIRYMMYLFEG